MINHLQYVGIPKRALALLIDGLIQTVVGFVLFFGVSKQELATTTKFFSYAILSMVIQWGYFCLMESSKARGSFGKMALGISVCDATGRQISLKQSSIRYLGKSLWIVLFFVGLAIGAGILVSDNPQSPALLLALLLWLVALLLGAVGYLMPAFTPERQALHDRMAHTYVIEDDSPDRKVTQTVIFQMIAIAIAARLMFHVIPGMPLPSKLSGESPQTNQQGVQTEQNDSRPTQNEDSTANQNRPVDDSNRNQGTSTIARCGVTAQLSPPNPDSYIDGAWKLNFSAGIEAHEALLVISKDTGVMRTEFFDNNSGKTRAVLQKMQLKAAPDGVWLLGSTAINAETNQPDPTYSPDNIFIQRAPSGQFTAVNCDNNNKRSRVSITRVKNNN